MKPARHLWAPLAVAAVLACGPLWMPDLLVTMFNYVGLYALVCIGLVLLTGIAGLTSFGQAAFVGLGAYTTAVLTTQFGLSPWLSLPASVVVSGLAALALGWLTVRLSSHYLVLGTIAWGLSLYYLMGNLQGLGGHNGLSGIPSLQSAGAGGLRTEVLFYLIIWAVNGAAFWMAANLLNSREGRAIRSLRDPLMAQSFGVDANRLKVAVFAVAAMLAGVSGWLHAHYVSVVNPGPFGINASVDYLFMTVVGGAASLGGALVGPLLVEGLRTLARYVVPGLTQTGGTYEVILFGVVILLLLRGASGGLMSALSRWLPARPAPAAPATAVATTAGAALPRRVMPAADTPLLQVNAIERRFGGLVAVDRVGFELKARRILGVIGPNGAGKSTLFNLLTGVLRPTAGEARLLGGPLSGLSPRQVAALGVARTFQHVRLRADMTVLENVALGLYRRGRSGLLRGSLRLDRQEEAAALQEAQHQLDRVGLGAQAALLAGTLPLGQQRILEIARALASDPQLLLLDEPAAGLRKQEKDALAALLRQLRAEGVTVLLVEHDMDFVMNLVDGLVVLQFGQVIAEGAPADVRHDPRVLEAYLGTAED